MNIRGKIFYPAALSAMLLTSSAMAIIPSTACVGVTEYFRKDAANNIDMEHYSLTGGFVALDTKLAEGIRLSGPFTPGYSHGWRDYSEDISDDPHWNLAFIYYPSNDGQLSTTFDSATNFAIHVKDAKTIALLANYSKKVEDVKGRGSLPNLVTQKFAADILGTLKLPHGAGSETIKKLKQKTLNPLLDFTRKAIEAEKNGTTIFPKGTAVQILMSFFCYHFDTPADIRRLLEELDGSIVDKKKPLPPLDRFLTKDDLPLIAAKAEKKEQDLNLDDFFNLSQEYIFTSVTPFKPRTNLVGNGTTKFYNRTTDKTNPSDTFQDCVETGSRLFYHIITFNARTRQFDSGPIESHVARREQETGFPNPYIGNFKKFYSTQTMFTANAGDIVTRSAWNRVLAHLPKTIYRRNNTNEIRSGFINFLNTADTLFSLCLETPPITGLPAKKQWATASFKTLCSALNPSYDYTVDFDDTTADYKDELIGNALITAIIKDSWGLKVFSFNLYSELWENSLGQEKGHTKIHQLKVFKNPAKAYTKILEENCHILKKGTTAESFLLLAPPRMWADLHPFYRLYRRPLVDNDSRLNYLKTLVNEYRDWNLNRHQMSPLQLMTRNVMQNIAWSDGNVCRDALPTIALMMGIDPFVDLVSEEAEEVLETLKEWTMLSFAKDNFSIVRGLRNLPSLITLEANEAKTLKQIIFEDLLENLQHIEAKKSGIQKILGFENLPKLGYLHLEETKDLISLTVNKRHENLKRIYLPNSGIREFIGLEYLPNLEVFEGEGTKNLAGVAFKERLEKMYGLNFKNSGIIDLEGAENIPHMHSLILEGTTRFEKLTIRALLADLTKVNLAHSGVTEITGFEYLPHLREFYASHTPRLSSVAFTEENSQLKIASFSGSAIHTLTGLKFLKSLWKLNLCNTLNLTDLEFGTENKRGFILNLKGSGIKKPEDIEGYEYLNPNNVQW